MDTLLQDLRYALRTLSKSRGFTLVALLTLAVGIGANTVVFSVVDGVLFRSLPFHEPDELVQIHGIDPRNGDPFRPLSFPHYQAVREASALEATVATSPSRQTLVVGSGPAVEIDVARASDDLPGLLGVATALGRNPSRQEWSTGANVLVLTQSLWHSVFGGDSNIVGTTVSLEGRPFVVAAVLAAPAVYPPAAEAWRPMTAEERADDDPEHAVLARLAPGVDRRRAEQEIRALTRSYLEAGTSEPAGLEVRIANARDALVRGARGPLLMIQGAALAILLVMCLNVAHLLLARGESRRMELAVRAAVGADRLRLLTGLLVEAAVLVAMGCAVGILAATLALPALRTLIPAELPSLHEIEIDGRILGIVVAVSCATFLAFSLWPALRASSAPPRAALTGGRTAGQREQGWASRALVAGQVALSTVLVTAALLLATSFVRLSRVDRGFEGASLLYLPLTPSPAALIAAGGTTDYHSALLETATTTPGVAAAALTTHPPTATGALNFRLFALQGLTVAPDDRPIRGGVVAVSPGYFETAGLTLIDGRAFTSMDREETEQVAVVSESFARTYLADRPPLGAVFRRASFKGEAPIAVRVVGIVQDTRPIPGEPPPEMLYLPLSQLGFGPGLLVRASGEMGAAAVALRQSLRRFDPTLPTNRLAPLDPPERLTSTRFQAWTVGLFAGLGLSLAAVGIYGISAYTVARRRREIGIRRALGASSRSVQLGVLRSAATVTGLGALAGLAGAAVLAGFLRGLVFGVDPLAPSVLVAVVTSLGVVSLLAAWLPARRAARVDPMIALRME